MSPHPPPPPSARPLVIVAILIVFAALTMFGAIGFLFIKQGKPYRAKFEVALGAEALRQRNLPLAEQHFKKATELDPSLIEARRGMADLLTQSKRPSEALRVYEELVTADPGNAGVRIGFAMLLDQVGRYADAERELREARKLSPEDPTVNNNLAYLLAEQNRDLKVALEMAQRAVNARNEDGFIWDTLGWVYYRLKDYKEAEYSLRRAVQLGGTATDAANYHLAMVCLKMKDLKQARTHFNLVPNDSDFGPLAEAALKALMAGTPVADEIKPTKNVVKQQ